MSKVTTYSKVTPATLDDMRLEQFYLLGLVDF